MAVDIKPEELAPELARAVNVHDRGAWRQSKHLARAAKQAADRRLADYLMVDSDAHHYETESWADIIKYLEDPVLRHRAENALLGGRPNLDMTHGAPTRQNVYGRILTDDRTYFRGEREESGKPADLAMIRNEMNAIGLDYQVVFPTPMLSLGMHPDHQIESALSWAYSRWMTEELLPQDDYIKTMVYLPFNDPDACERVIDHFSDKPGVVGFEVTSARYKPVHDDVYMRIYAMLEERGLPIAFHAGFYDWERFNVGMNKFISVHSIGFVIYNLIHMINIVINGIPERFPNLKIVWIESGLAWLPFLMQRLDNEYTMRTSEAPLLKKLPSEYMRDFFYTSQPLEIADPEGVEMSMEMINAETQLLFASDYPHWDFNLPCTIYDLPFLSEQGKRNILGENAQKLFKLGGKRPKPTPTVTGNGH